MESRWILRGAGDQVRSWTEVAGDRRPRRMVHPVLTVRQVCRSLRKSRRQVYRYMKTGLLVPCARILGQWLFAPEETRLFSKRQIPRFLKPYFWDTRLSNLSVDRHRPFILGRILESGDQKAVSWALRTYPSAEISSFLRGHGKEVLSQRTWNFWALLLGGGAPRHGTRPGAGHGRWPGRQGFSWRHRGRRWGGLL